MKTSVAATIPQALPEELRAVTPEELAKLLGLSAKTIYEQASKGKIPGRIPLDVRKVRFARPVIMEWLASGATPKAGSKSR